MPLAQAKLTREQLRQSWRSWYAEDLNRVGPGWLQWVWTLLFCAVIAVGFTLLGGLAYAPMRRGNLGSAAVWLHWYGINFGVSLTIGVTIHLLFDFFGWSIGRERIRRFSNAQRGVFFAGVPMLGVAVGWPLGVLLVLPDGTRWFPLDKPFVVVASVLASMLISLVFYVFFAAKARQIEAERRATEAQLRLLQGQIEPHFLFNTLANVHSLIEHDPPKARAMLESFIDYLRASLGSLRGGDSTLDAELKLAEAYLTLLQIRMEDRLRFSIDASEDARRVKLPPLLLQPLIENAIHHGLEPKIAGGRIAVRARLHGGQVELEVQDDGLGLDAASAGRQKKGAGVALDNIRQRLAQRYGNAASLTVQAATPGVLATLRLPLQPEPSTCPPH